MLVASGGLRKATLLSWRRPSFHSKDPTVDNNHTQDWRRSSNGRTDEHTFTVPILDTHTSVCAHSKAHFYLFLFFFLTRADYIHKSCIYFSGGRKMLLSRPISSSHCAAASLSLYFHPGIQKIISFLLQLLGGRGKKKIHRGGPIYRHTKAELSFSLGTGST